MITKIAINRVVKVHDDQIMDGCSTFHKKNDPFIKTTQVIGKARTKLEEQVNLVSPCVHKELSSGSRNYHDNIVTDMKKKRIRIL